METHHFVTFIKSNTLYRSMSKSMGKEMTEEEAEKTIEMMKGMKPETMKRMMQAAKVVKQTTETVKKVSKAFLTREALMLAVFMLILAIALHYTGIIG